MTIYTFSRQASADELAAEMDRRGEVIEALEAIITSLRAELERKDAALRFYAERANYRSRIGMDSPISEDNFGDKARAALSAQKEEEAWPKTKSPH